MSGRRASGAAAAISTAALLTLGCGAEQPHEDEATEGAVESARTETVTRFSVAGRGEPHEFRARGVIDYANDRREDVDGTTGCRTITIGEVSYSELPESAGAGKRWVRYDESTEKSFEEIERANARAGGVSEYVIFVSVPDPPPDEYLEHLRRLSNEVTPIGRESVDGVLAMRYRARVGVRERTRRELASAGWKSQNIERYLETVVDGTEEVDVWVDPDGVARRIETRQWSDSPEPDVADTTITTTRFFDFGVETTIEPPAASDVIDADEWGRMVEEQQKDDLRGLESYFREGGHEVDPAVTSTLSPDAEAPPSCLH